MIEPKIAAFAVALVVVTGLFVAYQISLKRTLSRTLIARPRVPASEFGAYYYADSNKAAIGTFLLVTLEELTCYQLTGVIPTGRLVGDLHLDELDSLTTVEIITRVESRFDIEITDQEAAHIQSVADFVNVIAYKTSEHRARCTQ